MQQRTAVATKSQFAEEVQQGLSSHPKFLSSKYFYDKKGDRLFQQIMALPEYYLTRCEMSILETHKAEIIDHFVRDAHHFNLVELGAGDGKKTKVLLRSLADIKMPFNYMPIDISQNALDQLEESIKTEIPHITVDPLQGTYLDTLQTLDSLGMTKKVILFLGSNIGNMTHPQAISFLTNIQKSMRKGDLLFIGFDQKKNPQTILDAYNDATGTTEAFNKNILARINTELQGDFDLDKFFHWEVYDPESGTAKSYLVSKEAQTASIGALELEIDFEAWETIHTEISQKYDAGMVRKLTEEAGLVVETYFTDAGDRYRNYLLKKV
ncbi:MAG: L-histidine N(alpha)-methyltransferase [Sediminicola sp.]